MLVEIVMSEDDMEQKKKKVHNLSLSERLHSSSLKLSKLVGKSPLSGLTSAFSAHMQLH